MNKRTIRTLGLVTCLLSTAPVLLAQESGFEGALKFRGAFQVASTKDNLSPALMGAGFELGYPTSAGILAGELGLFYKPGSQYLKDLGQGGLASGAGLDRSNSVDSRKSELNGYYLRLSWEKPLTCISVRAGLQVANARFREEYIGDLQGSVGGAAFRDSYNGVLQKSAVTFSPFVGVKIPLVPSQYLEIQVIALGYTANTYVHVAGTVAASTGGHTDQDHILENKRTVPHLEVAYGISF